MPRLSTSKIIDFVKLLDEKKEQVIDSHIECHPEIDNDLKRLIGNSGLENALSIILFKRIEFILELRHDVYKNKNFKILKDTDGMIRFKMVIGQRMNLRIIFKWVQLNGIEKAVLLHAFNEKDSKNNSDTSYSKAIKVAKKRLDEIVKE